MTEEHSAVTAVAADRYGGPEGLGLIETTPVPPAAGQVQIAVRAVALNRSDLLAMRGEPFFMRLGNGITRPRHPVPGSDVAGVIVAAGHGVDAFTPGDAVVADLSAYGRGGLAEVITVDAEAVVHLPTGLTMEAGAALPTAGVTAFQALATVARVQQGERVLIEGASGGVGGFAIQIARMLGAHVTAVVGRGKTEQALALGADRVVDYTRENPTDPSKGAPAQSPAQSAPSHKASSMEATHALPLYDVVYAVNGHRNLAEYQRVLSPEGRFVMTGGTGSLMLQTMLAGRRFRFHTMTTRREDLSRILDEAAAGVIDPNIVARYPLSRAAEALKTLEAGHAAGKIIVTVEKGVKNEI